MEREAAKEREKREAKEAREAQREVVGLGARVDEEARRQIGGELGRQLLAQPHDVCGAARHVPQAQAALLRRAGGARRALRPARTRAVVTTQAAAARGAQADGLLRVGRRATAAGGGGVEPRHDGGAGEGAGDGRGLVHALLSHDRPGHAVPRPKLRTSKRAVIRHGRPGGATAE